MTDHCPISVLIPVKNEERNLGPCLEAIADWADEIIVVDSQSTDSTQDIAASHGARVVQFHYQGGWPKKRQWALDNIKWKHDWILLLDADEILPRETKAEIARVIQWNGFNGYWIRLRIVFLGRILRYGGTELWKLSLVRKGKAHYEIRFENQDSSMADMEVHEHVVVEGKTGRIHHPVRHQNFNSLDRYIEKHNAYSNWEARLLHEGGRGEVIPSLFGNQAQRRRFLKDKLLALPGSPIWYFLLKYVFQLGFLDGTAGFVHSALKGVQKFHVKAKLYEIRQAEKKSHT